MSQAHNPYTVSDFDAAAAHILGRARYERTLEALHRPGVCVLIAKEVFVGKHPNANARDLDVIRVTASNLWDGNGESGLKP